MTMKTTKLSHRIENRFWDFVIPILETETFFVEKLVNTLYYTYKRYRLMNFFFKSFFWGCMGLTFGLFIGKLF
jgi:predicted DNA-binding ribbon-helix-helix protein